MKDLATELRERLQVPDTVFDKDILKYTSGTFFRAVVELDRSVRIFKKELKKCCEVVLQKLHV